VPFTIPPFQTFYLPQLIHVSKLQETVTRYDFPHRSRNSFLAGDSGSQRVLRSKLFLRKHISTKYRRVCIITCMTRTRPSLLYKWAGRTGFITSHL
jgi:hypothetical protein